MAKTTAGEKLRAIREGLGLSLREVAATIGVDTAILSKLERGERKLNKETVLKLADIYGHDRDELLLAFLSDRILYEIEGEELGEKALRLAEDRIGYQKNK